MIISHCKDPTFNQPNADLEVSGDSLYGPHKISKIANSNPTAERMFLPSKNSLILLLMPLFVSEKALFGEQES